MSPIYTDNSLSIGRTPLVRLNKLTEGAPATVLVKVEGRNPSYSVKCRIGASMIWDAEQRGVLNAIVHFSLRYRWIVVVLATVLTGYGLYTLVEAKYDVFPEFAPPQVVVETEAPGLAPEQVELLVTQPVENALGGVAGVTAMRPALTPA